MGISNLRAGLEKRYSALTGQLEDVRENIARIRREAEKLPDLEARIPKLEALVESTALLLQDIHPEWQRHEARAIKPWARHSPVPFGTCGRRGMNILRQADQPMTAKQVALQVLREIGHEEPDKLTIKRVVNAVDGTFRHFRGRTTESSGRYPAEWRAINKPEIEFGP